MKTMKKWIALATAVMMFAGSTKVVAGDMYQEYAGGGGYIESRDTPSLAPAIALGAIALVAIIAIAVQNSNSGHGHSH